MNTSVVPMKNLGKAVLLAGLVAVASGCSSSSDSASPTGPSVADLEQAVADASEAVVAIQASTPVGVYDGAATGCTVMTADAANTAMENPTQAGVYGFATTIADNTVVTATGCLDSDTGLQLAPMKGVVVNQAVLVTPIASLVVEAVLVAGAATVAPGDLATATAAINTALGLDSTFDATNPETGNYASDVTTNPASQSVQEAAFMVAVMMKLTEKSDPTAMSEFAQSIAASTTELTPASVAALAPGSVDSGAIETILLKLDGATSTALMGAIVQAAAVTLNDATMTTLDAATAAAAIDVATLTPITLVDAADAVAAKAAALEAAQLALTAAEEALAAATTGATGASS